MKIFMIAPEPFFEPRGTPLSVLFRIKALNKLGHKIDLLTYPVGKDVDVRGLKIIRVPNLLFIKKVKIGPSLLKIPLDLMLLLKAAIILRKSEYDCIHVHEEASVIGILLKKIFKLPLIYDMHSSMPEQLVNYNFSKNSVLINLFNWIEKKVTSESNVIIVVCRNLEKKVRAITNNKKILLIENTQTLENYTNNNEIEKLREELGIHNEKVVLYAGTFEYNQGLEVLIKSIPLIVREINNVKFVLVGGEKWQIKELKKEIEALKAKEG